MVSCQSPMTDNHAQVIQDSLTEAKEHNSIRTIDTTATSQASAQQVMFKDSIIDPFSQHFKPVKLKLTTISSKKYQELQQQQTNACASDTGAFFASKGLRYHQSCHEVCVSFLTDLKNGVRMVVPSTYDGGITAMVVSPHCTRLVVHSAYDGTDYSNYYEERSEFYTFQVLEGKGIQVLQPEMMYFTKSFTIEEMFWTNDNTLLLKTYAGDRQQDNEGKLKYLYYQATLPEN